MWLKEGAKLKIPMASGFEHATFVKVSEASQKLEKVTNVPLISFFDFKYESPRTAWPKAYEESFITT